MLGFDRITFDPHVMGGRACIRGMRITVALLVNLVANGMTIAEIIDAYGRGSGSVPSCMSGSCRLWGKVRSNAPAPFSSNTKELR